MTSSGAVVTEGFDAFRRGAFGNGGQNIYVSRAGVLQRIHQYDLDRDGYLDIVICNSQPHGEQPPSFLYRDPPAEGQPHRAAVRRRMVRRGRGPQRRRLR